MDETVPSYEPLLWFWFGEPGQDPLERQATWFAKDPAFDAELRSLFGELHERVARGKLEVWRHIPRGMLAYVLLLDQLSRNLHRGTPDAFAHDARALAASLEAQARGMDRRLSLVERWFLYMPMTHAEDREVQDRSVTVFERLASEATGPLSKVLEDVVRFAVMHRDIVARFGRFPHRNAILERASTAEEEAFLKEPGSSF